MASVRRSHAVGKNVRRYSVAGHHFFGGHRYWVGGHRFRLEAIATRLEAIARSDSAHV